MSYSSGFMTPQSNADTLGTMVKVALIDSAHAYTTLQQVAEALHADDIDKVKLIVGNYFAPGSSPSTALTDLQAALYDALPRGGGGVSYG